MSYVDNSAEKGNYDTEENLNNERYKEAYKKYLENAKSNGKTPVSINSFLNTVLPVQEQILENREKTYAMLFENIKSFNGYSKKALDTLEKQMIIVSAGSAAVAPAALPAELAAMGYMELMEAILGFMASITDLTQKALVDNLSDEENKLSTYKSEILDILSSSLGLIGRFIDEKSITDSALNTSRKLYSSLEKNNADNAKDVVSDAASKINKQNIKKEIYELAQKVVEDSEEEKAEKSNVINDKKDNNKSKDPMLNEDWHNYFNKKYGANSVTWESISIQDIVDMPSKITNFSQKQISDLAKRNGWSVEPLGKGHFAGISYE